MMDLPKLVAELASDLGYATGERKFPRAVTEEEAIELALVLMRNVSQRAEQRAQAAVENRVKIACELGCTGCCEEMVIVAEPEALLIRKFLSRPENAIARAHFLDAFARWRERAGHIQFGPMVEMLQQAHHLLQAAHNASCDRTNQHQSVCVAVHRLLTNG